MDDIIVIEDDLKEIEWLKKHLAVKFDIKDLRRLRYFLGIDVAHLNKCIFISQQIYVLYLVKETEMLGCKPTNTLIEQNHRLVYDKNEAKVDLRYFLKISKKIDLLVKHQA